MAHTGRLQGKVAIITGAGSGIGRATAERFAQEGALLVLNDLDEARLQAVIQSTPNPDQHAYVIGDISLEETAIRLSEAAIQRHDRIDVLVNNAGIHYIQDITDISAEEFDRCIGINLKSMFLCCKAVIPQMQKQRSGSIINLGSISSFVGQEMLGRSTVLYNITKAGALQLTKSLATRYAAEGIRVNAICPGGTRTNQITEEHTQNAVTMDQFWQFAGDSHPMGRYGEPAEIANGILFLASDEASFMTGAPLIIDGGYLAR
ncbi:SDR family NAD(P)-dependent oxidoreductase [Brevibacillus panacihumi]|uniref:SDR family oxidoreductase n=1 Tax=Brevibacillus panacihumi TaxID=497735 RepID=A0A3M8CTC2_9BACL|nr:SDR family oxidoreductase [Brevibacillus panacihumi]RNB78641.1 SDR family oxidoreductase [Brevibacillus panacihumi]